MIHRVGRVQPHFFASPEVVHRPRSDSSLHFQKLILIQNSSHTVCSSQFTRLKRAKTLPQQPLTTIPSIPSHYEAPMIFWHLDIRVEFLIFFRTFQFFSSDFRPIFLDCSFCMLFSTFFRARNSAKHPENTPPTSDTADRRSLSTLRRSDLGLEKGVRRSDLDLKKRVFCGENRHDPEQSKGLEARIKTPRGTPKNTIQCKNPPTGIPNFERRAAAAAARLRLAFAPATLLEHWLQVGSRFAASRSRSHYYRRIVSFPQQYIR